MATASYRQRKLRHYRAIYRRLYCYYLRVLDDLSCRRYTNRRGKYKTQGWKSVEEKVLEEEDMKKFEVMACPILPTYKDRRLHTCIADLMERFNPGTIPAVGTTDYNVVLKAIGKRLTTQRFNVLNEIKGSIDKNTNLFCLAAEILPEGSQRTFMVFGRIAIVADYTGIRQLIPMKDKSVTFDYLREFIIRLERQAKVSVKYIRTDNGGEFLSSIAKKWYRDNGYVHQTSPAYTPQNNSVVERYNRYATETISSMLSKTALGHDYWDYAAQYAAIIHCHTTRSDNGNGETAWKLFTGRSADIDKLLEWGSICFVHAAGPGSRFRCPVPVVPFLGCAIFDLKTWMDPVYKKIKNKRLEVLLVTKGDYMVQNRRMSNAFNAGGFLDGASRVTLRLAVLRAPLADTPSTYPQPPEPLLCLPPPALLPPGLPHLHYRPPTSSTRPPSNNHPDGAARTISNTITSILRQVWHYVLASTPILRIWSLLSSPSGIRADPPMFLSSAKKRSRAIAISLCDVFFPSSFRYHIVVLYRISLCDVSALTSSSYPGSPNGGIFCNMAFMGSKDRYASQALSDEAGRGDGPCDSVGQLVDSFLANIDLIRLLDPPPTPTPQRVRCAKLWSDQLSSFVETASQPERKHLAENASKIGRSGLRQIPYFEPLRLSSGIHHLVAQHFSNHEIAAGLHYRLLTPAFSPTCSACAEDSGLAHDEVCRLRETWSTRRHDSINRVLHTYLSRVAGATVSLEPSTQEGRRRNDLRVYGLEDKHMYAVQGGKPREMEWIDWVRGRIVAWLSKRDAEVVEKAPRIYGGAFRPLVFSAGGLMCEETAVEWRSWRKGMEKEGGNRAGEGASEDVVDMSNPFSSCRLSTSPHGLERYLVPLIRLNRSANASLRLSNIHFRVGLLNDRHLQNLVRWLRKKYKDMYSKIETATVDLSGPFNEEQLRQEWDKEKNCMAEERRDAKERKGIYAKLIKLVEARDEALEKSKSQALRRGLQRVQLARGLEAAKEGGAGRQAGAGGEGKQRGQAERASREGKQGE
ncbi:hypothetical protein B9479_002473 [Cryptococcus floricola]|uniref:Integrase catalytic domain-containing protein n=1 Tax=Cryptococcus floricola TaxID=2591691 RepID=A0A5D3B1B3_9TREE|nr:hypothetical protein B9479_002473 [Cryptococcus floricola]